MTGLSRLAPLGTALALAAAACRGGAEDAPAAPGPSASAVPVDRLAPGELRPGTEALYGLVLPEGMTIIARYSDALHAAGRLSPEHIANYVRDRVVVSRVELGAARTIFPDAKIRGGDAARTYQIEIAAAGKDRTILEVRDVTPPKKIEGLSNDQRLKQVGLKPDGKLLEPSKME